MHRAILLAAAALAFAAVAVPGASPSSSSPTRANADSITLRLRYKNGPWLKVLRLPLNRQHLKEFKLCGVWNWPAGKAFTCNGAGAALPQRTVMRMEQTPVANAQKRPESPGWGLVAMTGDPVLRVPLSNTVTGDRWGTFYYRASLRDLSGKVMLTSNRVKLVWRKP